MFGIRCSAMASGVFRQSKCAFQAAAAVAAGSLSSERVKPAKSSANQFGSTKSVSGSAAGPLAPIESIRERVNGSSAFEMVLAVPPTS